MRYTPAGLPALDLLLQHDSEVRHEGQVRRVGLQLKALAIGSLVAPLQATALGESVACAGFLAPGRNGRGLVFHITEIGR